eukprot:PhF_6_TR13040/c0_g1_i1/m.20699
MALQFRFLNLIVTCGVIGLLHSVTSVSGSSSSSTFSLLPYLISNWEIDPNEPHFPFGGFIQMKAAVYEGAVLGFLQQRTSLTYVEGDEPAPLKIHFRFEEDSPTTGTFEIVDNENASLPNGAVSVSYSIVGSKFSAATPFTVQYSSGHHASFEYRLILLTRDRFQLILSNTLDNEITTLTATRATRGKQHNNDDFGTTEWVAFVVLLVVFIRLVYFVMLPKEKKRKITARNFQNVEKIRSEIIASQQPQPATT